MCGQAGKPLKFMKLVRYFGFFMTAYYQSMTGYMCTGCALKSFATYTAISLPSLIIHPGWGLILAPWTFLKNITNLIMGKPIIGDYERALMFSEEDLSSGAIDITGVYARRFKELGDQNWAKKDYDSSLFYYSKAINFGIKDIDVYLNYGNRKLQTGDFDSALNATNMAIEMHSQSAELYLLRGRVKMRSPDVEKTIQDFDRAEALGSTVPELYYGRAQLWEKKGNIEKALDDWQNVLRLTSDPAMVKEAEKRKAKLSKKLIAR